MAAPWLIHVYDGQQLVCIKECVGPLELGRQDTSKQEQLYEHLNLITGGCRLVIALNEEIGVSRQHVRIEPVDDTSIRLRNLSAKVSFRIGNNPLDEARILKPSQSWVVEMPAFVEIGTKVVNLQTVSPEVSKTLLQSLEVPTPAPFDCGDHFSRIPALGAREISDTEGEQVIQWLKATMGVLQSAATSSDFYQKAAQAVVEVGRMDNGRVLIRTDYEWNTVACFQSCGSENHVEPPSRVVLKRVCEEKRTFWFDPFQVADHEGEAASSLSGVHAAVAAPILDRQGHVIAALYGERRLMSIPIKNRMLSKVDALLVELLAGGVAAGLARVQQERKALGLLSQFEQFFTPELARKLVECPDLLMTGRDQEITVLFCDVRGFSRISHELGPARTLEWIGDVLSILSNCVLEHGGVLVDYIGDALMAMWGAPELQPEHAASACLAAQAMLCVLPELNATWQSVLGAPMGLSIGINTGIAQVGNIGSVRKFKYGALGDTVNVASRVQGAAKYFKTNLLLTRDTRKGLGPEFAVRRLGLVRLVNIGDPIELFELVPGERSKVAELARQYEEGLAEFEAGQFGAASRILGRLVNDYPDDGPSVALLARSVGYLVEEPILFDPAFRLPGK
jgi:adenylate cyclase